MRYHTLALTAVLGHAANTPYNPQQRRGRFTYRVDLETTKIPSDDPGKKSRSYIVLFDMSHPDPNRWSIEHIDINSPYLKARKYPRITAFEHRGSNADVRVDNSQEQEYDVRVKAYNGREIIVNYSSSNGSGEMRGRFGEDLSYVEIKDIGPNPKKQTAVIEGIVRFVEIKAL